MNRPRRGVLVFADALVTAAQNRALHGRDNAHVATAMATLVTTLRAAAHLGVEMPLRLQFADDRMLYEGVPLLAPSLQAQQFLRELQAREIGALAFAVALTADEANRLFDLLLLEEHRGALRQPHRDRALAAFGIRNVIVAPRAAAGPDDRAGPLEGADAADLHRYQDLAGSLQRNNARAQRNLFLEVDDARSAVERALLRLEQEPAGLLSLAAIDSVDRFTIGHSVRVALLALQVARAAGAGRDDLVRVGTAALLHDIGKSKVPQEILCKAGPLDEEEWTWMAQHPQLGAEILLEQDDLHPSAIGAAYCHHMRGEGGGYPQPAVPVRPSSTSRLVRVCDVFEALTSVRPYKRALTPAEAYAVMQRDEFEFDPRWFALLVRTLGIFPTGTLVTLDDGATAIVSRQGPRPDQPVVRLLHGAGGAHLPAGAPADLTVGDASGGAARWVRSVCAHDRTVQLPPPAAGEGPGIRSQTAHGACLHGTGRRRP